VPGTSLWCVRVQWCSDTVACSKTYCKKTTDASDAAALSRIVAEITADLNEDQPSGDCNPPYP